jgi:L-alanine-DL-glutamate epimerase-like enolase superfamily enzyme
MQPGREWLGLTLRSRPEGRLRRPGGPERDPGLDSLNTQILDARVEFIEWPYVTPFPLRGGLIYEVTEARVEVVVRVDGREAVGRGSTYLGVVWAWPDPALTYQERDVVFQEVCKTIARDLRHLCGGEPAHPTELGLRLHAAVCEDDGESPPPALARAVCASPFDAAIHDAVGLALGRSSFDLYTDSDALPSADRLFAGGSASAAIRRVLRPAIPRLDAWLIVGPSVSLDEEMLPWVRDRGYHCFKIKIPVQPGADVARTVEVYRAARRFGVERPRITADSNELHGDAAAVREYLERLKATDAEAFAALEYLEQPTDRDIRTHHFDWRPVAALKPVILDEGLISFASLEEASDQGWSGYAAKTCKGHSFSMVVAAWAHENGMALTLQDLTNPGLTAIHAALFAAHVQTLNGIELNSPQFTPAANAEWLPRLAGLLAPHDGYHRLPAATPPGLGSTL